MRKLIALPIAGGLAFGAAGLATGDEPKPVKRAAPLQIKSSFLPDQIGFDSALGDELAKELGMTTEKVDAALRKVLEKRLNAHRDRVLACFDDPGRCGAIERPAIALPHVAAPFEIRPRP